MNSFLPLKKKAMKTATLAISPEIFRRYLTVAIATALAAALLTTTATAQGRHGGGGERGGGGDRGNGGNFGRSPETNRVPAADNRRWGGSSERGLPGRDNPGVGNNNRDFGRNNDIVRGDNNRDFNRNNNGQGNNRGFNRNNDVTRGNGNRDFNNNRFPGRDRMDVPGNADRNFNRNNSIDRRMPPNRPGGGYSNGQGNYRPVVGTMNRPAYRPNYFYDRRPVYDRYNPSWRYGFLPRRNCYFYSLPSTYININFGGIGYRYWDGVFYRPYNNLFTVIAPPIGLYINVLPLGYRTIYVHDYPYYYYNGTYYDRRNDDNYYVVSPPVGAVVESLPAGYETVVIDGETFYTADGAQYKPAIQQNGEIWYEVIKAN